MKFKGEKDPLYSTILHLRDTAPENPEKKSKIRSNPDEMAPENPEKNPENKSNLSPESKPQPQLDKTLASGLTNYIIHGDTIQNLGQVGGAGCDNMDNFNPIFSDNRKMGHNRSASDPKISSKHSNGLGAISDAPAMAGCSNGPGQT